MEHHFTGMGSDSSRPTTWMEFQALRSVLQRCVIFLARVLIAILISLAG